MTELYHRARADTVQLPLFGVNIRILMPAAVTGGAMSLFEEINGPGDGPPLHIHHDADENFYVANGSYRFHCDGTEFEAHEGDVVIAPRGRRHTFLNIGAERGRLVITMRPGGFETAFEKIHRRGLSPETDMDEIVEIAREHGLEFVGPNPMAG